MPKRDDQFTPAPTIHQLATLEKLQHQVQSAVGFLETYAKNKGERFPECEPKFLRVGVNSAMIETSALAQLLLAKKVITNTEYFDMLITQWESERDSYLEQLRKIDSGYSL